MTQEEKAKQAPQMAGGKHRNKTEIGISRKRLQKPQVGTGIVAQYVKPLPSVLASQIGADLSPG